MSKEAAQLLHDAGFYRCSSGKRIYYRKRLADRAISKAITRGEMGPLRAYECDDCGHWHLATKKAARSSEHNRGHR